MNKQRPNETYVEYVERIHDERDQAAADAEANKATEPLEPPKIYTRFGNICELQAVCTAWDRVFVKVVYEDGSFVHRWVYPHDLRSDGGAKAIFEIIKTLPIKEIERVE